MRKKILIITHTCCTMATLTPEASDVTSKPHESVTYKIFVIQAHFWTVERSRPQFSVFWGCAVALVYSTYCLDLPLKHQQGCDTTRVCEQYGYYTCKIHKPRPLLITTPTPRHAHLHNHTHSLAWTIKNYLLRTRTRQQSFLQYEQPF